MASLVDIKPVDREFYETRLREFLPERIIDIHTHVWLGERKPINRSVTWPGRVAKDNSIEDLLETYRLMLPGKSVAPLIFSIPPGEAAADEENRYVAESGAGHNVPALIFAMPSWSAEELEKRILAGGFVGVKAYLSVAPPYLPAAEIRIFDFLLPHHLEVLDRHGWIAMLHVPRPGRLRDPVNLAQMLEIEQRYPNVKLIIAHVGRAYCEEDVGDAFEVLAPTERMCFDFSANTNEAVFRKLIDAVGPKRILFGSDMPILRMRMRRICRDGRYVNLVPRGLYGDVSGDPNMGELDGEEAERLTFFLYEEIDAFRRAAESEGLAQGDIEDVFHNNARALIDSAGSATIGGSRMH